MNFKMSFIFLCLFVFVFWCKIFYSWCSGFTIKFTFAGNLIAFKVIAAQLGKQKMEKFRIMCNVVRQICQQKEQLIILWKIIITNMWKSVLFRTHAQCVCLCYYQSYTSCLIKNTYLLLVYKYKITMHGILQ